MHRGRPVQAKGVGDAGYAAQTRCADLPDGTTMTSLRETSLDAGTRPLAAQSTPNGKAQVASSWARILVLEDDAATSSRRRMAQVGGGVRERVVVRLHEIVEGNAQLLGERTYKAGSLRSKFGKATIALRLLDGVEAKANTVVVSGAVYGSNQHFLKGLATRQLPFVAEVRASELQRSDQSAGKTLARPTIAKHLCSADWSTVSLHPPSAEGAIEFRATRLPRLSPLSGVAGQLLAAQVAGIEGVHRGTIFAFTSELDGNLESLVGAVAWARWIRTTLRRKRRTETKRDGQPAASTQVNVLVRANIALAERQDERAARDLDKASVRGVLGGAERRLSFVELFAGAGGMGLGFLLAGHGASGYRSSFSGEVNPIYVETLRRNHAEFEQQRKLEGVVPENLTAVDLRSPKVREQVRRQVEAEGGLDVLIGGPPCQGFSNANRNSWSSSNPNNRLVDAYVSFVEALRPAIFVMENVQGILWTPRGNSDGSPSVIDDVARRMTRAGYSVFPKLLDAVWYGVPQFRSRFFLVGLRNDLGYKRDDFGSWGPFPRPTHGPDTDQPYVCVQDAISDLPSLKNGAGASVAPYDAPDASEANEFLHFVRKSAPPGVISDHVTSKHADYVIDRYRRIPPGGNWEDIVDTMSNYANVDRTHSNIYRRLTWQQPSITIGHYRKSMLVHPRQHRGLSLREASRLQSFPDWFRFAGTATGGGEGGLMHKQQQLANAVCPLVAKAIAEYLLRL